MIEVLIPTQWTNDVEHRRKIAEVLQLLVEKSNGLDSDWLDFNPNITPFTGAFSSLGTINGKYKYINEKTVLAWFYFQVILSGTAGGHFLWTPPVEPLLYSVGFGREAQTTGMSLHIIAAPGGGSHIIGGDGISPAGNNKTLIGSVIYPV